MGIGWNIAAVMGVVAAGAGLWGGYQAKKATAATERAVAAEQAVDALERTLEAERFAAAILAAENEANAARAAEYSNLREALLDGGEDAPLPDWLAAYISSLMEVSRP
ncbi:MAG: hypothetical protein EBT13_07225 [Rhodobacteraceae bacterium]|nr:hypothetical protein [Paracoccaceae bacterium]